MGWDKVSWDRYLHNIRSALIKRDALAGGGQATPGEDEVELERERRAWAAKARANLKRLARLVEGDFNRPRELATFYELRRWYENPARVNCRHRH